MAEERRQGHAELLDAFKEFKTDIKEDIKEIKDELKQIDTKVKDHITVNNKIHFNGHTPDKHIEDHHFLDKIKEEKKDVKGLKSKVVEEVVKFIAIAAITWAGYAMWDKFTTQVQVPFENKPKVEQSVNSK